MTTKTKELTDMATEVSTKLGDLSYNEAMAVLKIAQVQVRISKSFIVD